MTDKIDKIRQENGVIYDSTRVITHASKRRFCPYALIVSTGENEWGGKRGKQNHRIIKHEIVTFVNYVHFFFSLSKA